MGGSVKCIKLLSQFLEVETTREETRLASMNCDEQYTTLRSGIFTKFARNFSQNTFILS